MMGFAMVIVAPKERKHLSADALFRLVRSGFDTIPDHRSTDTEISLTDALMSAFAMFSLKSPSLLAFDTQRAEGNLRTIYGMAWGILPPRRFTVHRVSTRSTETVRAPIITRCWARRSSIRTCVK